MPASIKYLFKTQLLLTSLFFYPLVTQAQNGKINVIEGDFKNIKKENLGTNVNTSYTEKMPVISHDGTMLYFDRADDPSNVGNPATDDVWFSNLKDSVWQKCQNIGRPINNQGNNFVISVSPDKNTLLVGHVYNQEGETVAAGLSIAQKKNGQWMIPVKQTIDNYYNHHKYNEACMSADGNTLLFTLQRDDSEGEKDIYFSHKKADGSWSEPKSCGKVINTPGDETSPYLAADGVTLYFSSPGHPGYGRNDIFLTKRLDNSWTKWSEPKNLGNAINGPGWDAYYTVEASGKYAYMVSTENSLGATDIFRIKLPEKAKPDPVAMVHGKVYNAKTKKLIAADVVLKKIQGDSLVNTFQYNPEDSSFSTILQRGSRYRFVASNGKIISVPVDVDVTILNEFKDITVELFLAPANMIHAKVYNAKTNELMSASVEMKIGDSLVNSFQFNADDKISSLEVKEGFVYSFSASYGGFVSSTANVDITQPSGDVINENVSIYLTPIEKDKTISLNNIFFEENSATLKYDSKGELVRLAAIMQENPNMKILIGGHTSKNNASKKFNQKLSEERAKAVKHALIELGVPRNRLEHKGFGYSKPAYDVDNLWENHKNKRVDFTILEI